MSTEENKALVRRYVEEVFNKRNLSLVDEIFDTNHIFYANEILKGTEGIKQAVTGRTASFPDIHWTIEDMVAEGDKVAYRCTLRGTHQGDFMGFPPTGKQFETTTMFIQRIVGGKFVETWVVPDHLGMMQQLGVVPPVGSGGG